MIDSEILIIGGGPAGSATAWKLAESGREVLILEKEKSPGVKPCAGWIPPSVFRDLRTTPGEYPHALLRFKKIHLHLYGFSFPLPTCQYSIRRKEFDRWLLERSGVPLYRHKVKTIVKEKNRYVVDEAFRGQWVVGAGGALCPLSRSFFPENREGGREITAMEEEFWWPEGEKACHLHFFENRLPEYSWYLPKGGGWLNVGVGGRSDLMKKRGSGIKEHWNLFIEKMTRKGFLPHREFHPRGHRYSLRGRRTIWQKEQALLVGDGAGLATIDLGEGIGPAIKSGILAARAIMEKKPYRLEEVRKFSIPEILVRGRGGWKDL